MRKTIILFIVLASAGFAMADDWPQWRGAKGGGISVEKNWNPQAVSQGKVLWQKKVGSGYSAVSVVKERVFTVGNAGGNDVVVCLNAADGSEVWKFPYPCASPKSYPGPRCTPAVDIPTVSVYVLSREGVLYCLDAAKGTEKWKKDLKTEFGAKAPKWAFSSSPRIVGDTLLINEGAKGIALNKKTGTKIWVGGPGAGGYSSPVVYTKDGKQYVAVFAAKNIYGLDLKSGAEAWSFPWKTSYDVNATDPIVIGNEVFLSSGYGKGCALIDIKAKPTRAIWQSKALKSQFSGLLADKGMVYGIDGKAGDKNAQLKCVDFKTGAEKWAHKVGFGAIMGADGKIIFISGTGNLIVADMSPAGYNEIASSQLKLSGKCWTMPVLAYGRIYCRSVGGDLLCVDVRK